MSWSRNRGRHYMPLVALLVGAAILAAPAQARAAYNVEVFDDGVLQSGISVFVSGNSLVFFGATTHFDITNGSASSNNPGNQNGANLGMTGNAQVMSLFGAGGGTHTLSIIVSQTNWTAPTGNPLEVSSSGGGSLAATGATASATSTYQGFLDNTNTLYGTPAAGGTPLQTASTSTPPGLTNPLVYSPAVAVNPNAPGGTASFSLTDDLFFKVTVGAGGGTNFGASFTTDVTQIVPAPAGLVLALTGLPVLGVGTWLRRRRASV
jgi:hypothetical protein